MKWENNGDSWKSWKLYGKLVKDPILTKQTIKKRDKENTMENHTIVTLKKGEGRTIKAGGAWIFDNEIDTITGTFKNGDVVNVRDFDGYPMGKALLTRIPKSVSA